MRRTRGPVGALCALSSIQIYRLCSRPCRSERSSVPAGMPCVIQEAQAAPHPLRPPEDRRAASGRQIFGSRERTPPRSPSYNVQSIIRFGSGACRGSESFWEFGTGARRKGSLARGWRMNATKGHSQRLRFLWPFLTFQTQEAEISATRD